MEYLYLPIFAFSMFYYEIRQYIRYKYGYRDIV